MILAALNRGSGIYKPFYSVHLQRCLAFHTQSLCHVRGHKPRLAAEGKLERMINRYRSDSGMIYAPRGPICNSLESLKRDKSSCFNSFAWLQCLSTALCGSAYPKAFATSEATNHGSPPCVMTMRTPTAFGLECGKKACISVCGNGFLTLLP